MQDTTTKSIITIAIYGHGECNIKQKLNKKQKYDNVTLTTLCGLGAYGLIPTQESGDFYNVTQMLDILGNVFEQHNYGEPTSTSTRDILNEYLETINNKYGKFAEEQVNEELKKEIDSDDEDAVKISEITIQMKNEIPDYNSGNIVNVSYNKNYIFNDDDNYGLGIYFMDLTLQKTSNGTVNYVNTEDPTNFMPNRKLNLFDESDYQTFKDHIKSSNCPNKEEIMDVLNEHDTLKDMLNIDNDEKTDLKTICDFFCKRLKFDYMNIVDYTCNVCTLDERPGNASALSPKTLKRVRDYSHKQNKRKRPTYGGTRKKKLSRRRRGHRSRRF